MARLARNLTLYDGCYAHVISRSMRQMTMFNDEEDFRFFLDQLLVVKRRYDFKIFHYCLMHTHFHLAVGISKADDFSRAVQKLKSGYIRFFHTKYRLSGPLWRERYKSLLIENEGYLLACGRYIENNPVRAKLVNVDSDWPFSSSRYYQGGGSDLLVDRYEAGTPQLPTKENLLDRHLFEDGVGIGSAFFRFQLNERLSGRNHRQE